MNNKKSKLLKTVVSITAAIVLVVCGIFATKTFSSKVDGYIKVEVIDINGILIKEKNIAFKEGDSVVDLIQKNFYDVVYKDNMIMEIEGIKTPEDWSTFICIYLNGEMSMAALPEIHFKNEDKISFVETEVIY